MAPWFFQEIEKDGDETNVQHFEKNMSKTQHFFKNSRSWL
jgi:hypothetical protein